VVFIVVVVVAGAEPGAVGAALGMGWMGGVVMASRPSRTANARSRRRWCLTASQRWTSGAIASLTQISLASSGPQVLRERCHDLVTFGERHAGLLRSFPDEDLHPHKGTPGFAREGVWQFIYRVAGDLCEGVHAQQRGVQALERIGRAEAVWRRMARCRVRESPMVRHRCSLACPWASRVPSQASSVLRSG
jgi:hypothetical protein